MRIDQKQRNWPIILLLSEGVVVRNFVGSALTGHGYCVLCAADHEEVLQLLAADPNPIHVLLVCSSHSPDLALVEQCTVARPDLRVIILSGEMHAMLADGAELNVCSNSPSVPDVLLQTIQRAISDRAFAHQIGKP